jgi:heme A synthase
MQLNRFAKYAWAVLAFNLGVILWGAYVRASGSGCGNHWPLCNGEVAPRSPQVETIIEFAQRMSSGLAFLLVLALLVWALRAYPKSHPVRLGGGLSMLFIVTEALVGGGLVLFNWVAADDSTGRVISIAVHLVNTFLLLAALTLTAWWASGGDALHFRGQGAILWLFLFAFLGVLAVGVSGAINALGDTLFPVESLAQGVARDFSPQAHFLLRLRVWHPLIAVTVGFYSLFLAGLVAMFRVTMRVRRIAALLAICFVAQLLAGLVNLILLAPIWMQIVHLLLADLVWIKLVLLAAANFAEGEMHQVDIDIQLAASAKP